MGDIQRVICRVLEGRAMTVNSTRLVKLTYLIDYTYFQLFGRTLTGLRYQWDNYGPNALGNAILTEADKLVSKGIVHCTHVPNVYGSMTANYRLAASTGQSSLPPEAEVIARDILMQYGNLPTRTITALSKKTAPFKNAVQYDVLNMECSNPVVHGSPDDYQHYKQQEAEEGLTSIVELRTSLA